MEQLVLLVIIGLISLINWVMQKAAEKREQAKLERAAKRESRRSIYTQPPAPAPEAPRRVARPAQDPFKELMDALGLPSDQLPPPPATRRGAPFEEEEFASVEEVAPPPLPEPVVRQEPVRAKPSAPPKPDRKMIELASAFAAGEEKPAATAYRGTKLRELLATRDSQRKAVVLAEILGTPRGLAPAGALMTRGHL